MFCFFKMYIFFSLFSFCVPNVEKYCCVLKQCVFNKVSCKRYNVSRVQSVQSHFVCKIQSVQGTKWTWYKVTWHHHHCLWWMSVTSYRSHFVTKSLYNLTQVIHVYDCALGTIVINKKTILLLSVCPGDKYCLFLICFNRHFN